MRGLSVSFLILCFLPLGDSRSAAAGPAVPLAPGVRGLVTRSPGKVVVDGSLREWSEAFCTPVHYAHANLSERAAQFFYMWDDEALYIGLRCLDTKQANPAPLAATYDGDAVEFYVDTRTGDALGGKDWSAGAVHLFYSPFQGREMKPRWVIRSGIATSGTKLKGLEVAARGTPDSYEAEFKLPWRNFPGFDPHPGAVLALDAELCSGDGGTRTDRTFAYGSPLSVQQPASLGRVALVRGFDPEYFSAVGPAAFPLWVDTPWVQSEKATVQAVVAVPPAFMDVVGVVEVRLHDTDGKIVKTIPTTVSTFGPPELHFARAVARWPVDAFAPGTYFATARVVSRTGKTLTTVAPRMVSEAIVSGR